MIVEDEMLGCYDDRKDSAAPEARRALDIVKIGLFLSFRCVEDILREYVMLNIASVLKLFWC